jgi:hypothetical protein
MSALDQIQARCRDLLERGVLPRSATSKVLRRLLRPLLDTRVLEEERAGSGRRIVVRDAAALRDFLAGKFPGLSSFANAPARIQAAAKLRDSKALPSDSAEVVVLRAWRDNALLRTGAPAGAAAATAQHGVFAFLLGSGAAYTLRGTWAVVENPAALLHVERLGLSLAGAIYSRGRLSRHLVGWLAAQTASDFIALHLPDYDPVGLDDWERLRRALGSRTRLHLPADLERRFARLANAALLERPHSQAMIEPLRASTDPGTRRVIALIDRYHGGLEQETLFAELEDAQTRAADTRRR